MFHIQDSYSCVEIAPDLYEAALWVFNLDAENYQEADANEPYYEEGNVYYIRQRLSVFFELLLKTNRDLALRFREDFFSHIYEFLLPKMEGPVIVNDGLGRFISVYAFTLQVLEKRPNSETEEDLLYRVRNIANNYTSLVRDLAKADVGVSYSEYFSLQEKLDIYSSVFGDESPKKEPKQRGKKTKKKLKTPICEDDYDDE